MANQIFSFPSYYDSEIDLTTEQQAPVGIPAGVIGASERGPAFVPTTVGSFPDFRTKFGGLDPKLVATYAVQKHLENRNALTFVRVLGAGANNTTTDIDNTRTKGTVLNAGFKISASLTPDNAHGGAQGAVQFLVARHIITASEVYGQAGFTNNNSFFSTGSADEAFLVRGAIFCASGARIQVLSSNESWASNVDDAATVDASARTFKIVISSSDSTFASDEGNTGIKIFTASLDPSSDNYFAKILNTDPEKFSEAKHLVYADYAVDAEVAQVATGSGDVVIASGSANTSTTSGDTSQPFLNAFGRFDTRYSTAKTPYFISQPFGTTEYNLFFAETIDDGEFPNKQYKISIANLKKSNNPKNKFGSFSLLVRDFSDTDTAPKILESFNNLTLDPEDDNYVCRVIGDTKVSFNFDVENEDDRRLLVTGRFPNRSKYIRVISNEDVERKLVPAESLPFGFRGVSALDTNSRLMDRSGSSAAAFSGIKRLAANIGTAPADTLSSIVPPVPFRFKVTRGAVSTTAGQLEGAAGNLEIVDARYFWGVKVERTKDILNQNIFDETNSLVSSYTQFNGLDKLDVLVTGSYTDAFNNNKFSLAKVALGNTSLTDLTASANTHMREASYMRNGIPDVTNYTVQDNNGANRITLATLLNKGTDSATFNAFSNFAKFTCIVQGGFNGLNILDKNAAAMNDRASSTESRTDGTYGNVNALFVSPGFSYNQNGIGLTNNTIASYREATKIITDTVTSNINVLAIPGQKEPLVTDFASDRNGTYGFGFYVMDIPSYDSDGERIFDNENTLHPDPSQTADGFESRALDNQYGASYFPDVVMDDTDNNRRVTVPASVAAVSALSFNDKAAFPWFAPAGFNRGSLDFVVRAKTKINQPERERLFDVNINAIVKFPREGFVINSQNTLEQANTALHSINISRMVLDVKRQIADIGNRFIFEQATVELRQQFANKLTPVLTTVQSRQGIEAFKVICDDTNNTNADLDANRMNCKVIVIPTYAIEHIFIDFIITRTGVQFV